MRSTPLGPNSGPVHLIELDRDHPGFRDQSYRRRRDSIARQAHSYAGQGPVPHVAYTPEEHALWRTVGERLGELHRSLGVGWLASAAGGWVLAQQEVPQFEAVNHQLTWSTGFRLRPVAGLVEGGEFLAHLARGEFLATQYLRHPSRPFYTPEPDVLHELVGHASLLTQPAYAELHRSFGKAALALHEPSQYTRLDRLYWRSMEFGLVEEHGQPRALGAGLLSSCGELERIEHGAILRPCDTEAILETPYDPTEFQPELFVWPNLQALTNWVHESLGRLVQ